MRTYGSLFARFGSRLRTMRSASACVPAPGAFCISIGQNARVRCINRIRCRGGLPAGTVAKRYVIHAAGYNLGVLMRKLFGVGTPRSLRGGSGALCAGLLALPAFLSA
ncbi:MAG: hypothetical protein D6744_16915, partial [Planctomycetota bacterium]